MHAHRVLIVEDELFVALDLELLIHKHAPAARIVVCASVAEAQSALTEPVELALLDVDVLDGKTFEVAKALKSSGVPFIFVSGSRQEEIPPELTDVPFVPKPFAAPMIQTTLREVLPILGDAP